MMDSQVFSEFFQHQFIAQKITELKKLFDVQTIFSELFLCFQSIINDNQQQQIQSNFTKLNKKVDELFYLQQHQQPQQQLPPPQLPQQRVNFASLIAAKHQICYIFLYTCANFCRSIAVYQDVILVLKNFDPSICTVPPHRADCVFDPHVSHPLILRAAFEQQNLQYLHFVHSIQPDHANFFCIYIRVSIQIDCDFLKCIQQHFGTGITTRTSTDDLTWLVKIISAICTRTEHHLIDYVLHEIEPYLKQQPTIQIPLLFVRACFYKNVHIIQWMHQHQKHVLQSLFLPTITLSFMSVRDVSLQAFYEMLTNDLSIFLFLIDQQYFDIQNDQNKQYLFTEYEQACYKHYKSMQINTKTQQLISFLQTNHIGRSIFFDHFIKDGKYIQTYKHLYAVVKEQYDNVESHQQYCSHLCSDFVASDILQHVINKFL
jgi:hypothetical protein